MGLDEFIEYMRQEKMNIFRIWILCSTILLSFVIFSALVSGTVIYSNEKDNQAATNNQPATAPVGRWFTVRNASSECNNISITKVFKFTLATPTRCFITDSNLNILNASTIFNGDNCTLEYPLSFGSKYYVAFDGSGSQYTDYYFNSPGYFPKNYTYGIQVIQANANTYPPTSAPNVTDYEETITGMQLACDVKISNMSLTMNSTLVNNSNIYNRINETIFYNGIFQNSNTDMANCTFIVSGIVNKTQETNLTIGGNFTYDYGFLFGNRTFEINCSNYQNTGTTGIFYYTVDTTRFLLYVKTVEIENIINSLTLTMNDELFTMIWIIALYIALFYIGYRMTRDGSIISGLSLMCFTLVIDLFLSYKAYTGFSSLMSLAFPNIWLIVFVIGMAFLFIIKVIAIFSLRYRRYAINRIFQ